MTNYLAQAAYSAMLRHPALDRRVGRTKQLCDKNAKIHWSLEIMKHKIASNCWTHESLM